MMGDLQIGEAMRDRVHLYVTATNADYTGASGVSVTITDESGNEAAGVVVEEANGNYYCAFTPDVAGTWSIEWGIPSTVTSENGTMHPYKVGGGDITDIMTMIAAGGAGDLASVLSYVNTLPSVQLSIQGKADVGDVTTNALGTAMLDHLVQSSIAAAKPTVGSLMDKVFNKDGSQTFDATTDSLEALRDDSDLGYTDVLAAHNRHYCIFETPTGGTISSITITAVAGNKDLPNVIVPTLPGTITMAQVKLKGAIPVIRDGSGADNAVDGTCNIFVKLSTGTWGVNEVVAKFIPDDYWSIDVSSSPERCGLLSGGYDIKSVVTGAGTYNVRIGTIATDGTMYLRDPEVSFQLMWY